MLSEYQITKIIGEGSSCVVYQARKIKTDEELALKVFSSEKNLFDQELKILLIIENEKNSKSNLNCENLIKFFGFNKEYKIIEEELCDYNLINFANQYDLNLRGIKKISRMLLLALDTLHKIGIIHRDIKLGNILIKNDVIKLCDFGLSCLKTQNDFSYCGTKDYLAPEINSNYDEKIDIYACGIVISRLVKQLPSVIGPEDFLFQLLNPDPTLRYSAEQALRHPFFNEILPEIPDYKILQNFIKETKYGFIKKQGNILEFNYRIGNIKIVDQILYLKRHDTEFYQAKIYEAPETDLKYLIYLCKYVYNILEKWNKVFLQEGGYEYRVSGNNNIIMRNQDVEVTKKNNKIEIVKNRNKVPEYILRQMLEQFNGRTFHEIHSQKNDLTTMSFTDSIIANSNNQRYLFTKEYGWCIKNRLHLKFLLSNGIQFEVDLGRRLIKEDSGQIEINKKIDKQHYERLKIIRRFLKEIKIITSK